MEGLVAKIAPLFDRERSLLRWVALRGALTQLYISTVDSTSRVLPFSPSIEEAMGVVHGDGDPSIDVTPAWKSRLSGEQCSAVVGVFSALGIRLFDYERYAKLTVDEVNQDPRCRLNDAMALDFIVWSAVASLRTGVARDYFAAPEPDALERAGWYTDPLWGKAQRYWDGTDWTERVRGSDGQEQTSRLRAPKQQS